MFQWGWVGLTRAALCPGTFSAGRPAPSFTWFPPQSLALLAPSAPDILHAAQLLWAFADPWNQPVPAQNVGIQVNFHH